MNNLIKVVEELWNNPEQLEAQEALLAELVERGELEWVDDVLLVAKGPENTSLLTQEKYI